MLVLAAPLPARDRRVRGGSAGRVLDQRYADGVPYDPGRKMAAGPQWQNGNLADAHGVKRLLVACVLLTLESDISPDIDSEF